MHDQQKISESFPASSRAASHRNMPRMLVLLGNSSGVDLLHQANVTQVTADDYSRMMESVTSSTGMNHTALGLDKCSIEAELNQVRGNPALEEGEEGCGFVFCFFPPLAKLQGGFECETDERG